MNNNSNIHIEVKSESEPYLIKRPQGYFEYQLPISSKGILCIDGKVLLVGNTRGELELPGGKLEKGESPERTAEREVMEEVGVEVSGAQPVHAWVYEIYPNRHVFVIAYGVTAITHSINEIVLSVAEDEVGSAQWVPLADLDAKPMPHQYIVAIRKWAQRLQETSSNPDSLR